MRGRDPEGVALRQAGEVELQVVAVDLEECRALASLVLRQTPGLGHAAR